MTAVRQRYSIATGGGATPAPGGPTPGFKKGGMVAGKGFKKGAQHPKRIAGFTPQPAGKSC